MAFFAFARFAFGSAGDRRFVAGDFYQEF